MIGGEYLWRTKMTFGSDHGSFRTHAQTPCELARVAEARPFGEKLKSSKPCGVCLEENLNPLEFWY